MSTKVPKSKRSSTSKNIVLFFLLLVAIGLAGWNGIAATAVSRQKQVNQGVLDELDATRLEYKKFKEEKAKRKAAIFLLESRRDSAIRKLKRNNKQARSMMLICESPREIIPVFPDLIQSVVTNSGNVRCVNFYVPPYEHQLIVSSKYMKGVNFNDIATDEAKEKAGFETQVLTLKGGDSYTVKVVMVDENPEKSIERFSKIKVLLRGAGDEREIEISTPISRGFVGSRGTFNGSNKLVLPNAIPRTFYPSPFGNPGQRLAFPEADLDLLTQTFGIRPTDSEKAAGKKAGILMVQFAIRSTDNPAVLPTDRLVMGRLIIGQETPGALLLKYNPAKIRYELVK